MARAVDVAAYILKKRGRMSAMKLQKLVYYSQAWHATWEGRPLFAARIEAWANGPVCPDLYRRHRGHFEVTAKLFTDDGGNCRRLNADEIESIDVVLSEYGDQSAQYLSDLTHREAPWRDARAGLAPHERSTRPISLESMTEYYGGLIA